MVIWRKRGGEQNGDVIHTSLWEGGDRKEEFGDKLSCYHSNYHHCLCQEVDMDPIAMSTPLSLIHPLVYILRHVHVGREGGGGREVMGNDGNRIHEEHSKVSVHSSLS